MIRHLTASIEGLLLQKDSTLGKLFSMRGSAARKELLARQKKGDLLIPSDNCQKFDPVKGCLCGDSEFKPHKDE